MGETAPVPMRPREEQKESIPERKVEKVVTGVAKTKKKSEFRKLTDLFFYRDAGTVKSYIVSDVLVPSGKKAISDIARNTINMISEMVLNSISMALFGEPDRIGKGSSTASKVSYQQFFDRGRDRTRREPVTQSRIAGKFSFDDIIFERRVDAEDVLDRMTELVDQYQIVSVADLYEMADIKDDNYTNNKYGWSDISAVTIIPVRNGFILRLPRPMQIN